MFYAYVQRLDQYDLDNDLQNLKNVTTEPAKTQESK